jgi:5'-nucleotidase / UDP-sugar diphosphatase
MLHPNKEVIMVSHLRSRLHLAWVPSLLLALLLIATLVPAALAAGPDTKVNLLHFSDYHSHAVPFYSEGKPNQAGFARAIDYLKQAKATLSNPIILDGGDMMNAGTPAWSDKYQCAEMPMLNGIVDAMAVGNHDFDYGYSSFLKCKDSAQYPLLSANLVISPTGAPALTVDGKPYLVKQVGDVKIGLFAVAGPDYPSLVSRKNLTDTVRFDDPIAAAKKIVDTLRNEEQVNAVVAFGHEERDADYAMAQQVPGIDLILGTHSHLKSDFTKIPGTETYFISPYQYLTYISQVEMDFADGKLNGMTGKLVKMDENVPQDPAVQAQITRMQADLEADPKYAPRFVKIGSAGNELSVAGIDTGESVLGNFVMDNLRRTTKSNAAFSTASSFRASIPPGNIRMEDYLTALPYKNVLMTFDLTGTQVLDLLNYSLSKSGSANFSATSGLRYGIENGKVSNALILVDPANESAGFEALDPAKTYRVMTTDYQAKIAAGYKDIFAKATASDNTNLIVNDVMIDDIKNNSPVTGKLDGRVATGAARPAAPAPQALPTTGANESLPAGLALALMLLWAGWRLWRRNTADAGSN